MNVASKILVVDDEPLVRTTLAEILQVSGFSVASVGWAKVALEEIQKQFYNLILLDLNLPDMDGMEVLEHIKHYSPKTEVVVITGFATLESALGAMERGVMAYVEKPVRPNQLVTTVKGVLEKQALKLENDRVLRQLSALLYFTQDIVSDLELNGSLRRIVLRATELLGATQGFVALLEDDVLRMEEYWDGQQWFRLQAQWHSGEGVPGRVWSTHQSYLCADAQHDSLVAPTVRSRLRLTSCICAPILDSAGHFIGILQVNNKIGREPFSPDDLALLQVLGRQAAIPIQNAHLYQLQKEESEVSTLLLHAAERLSQVTDLDELLGAAADIVPDLLDCDQFGLFLFDRAKNMVYGAKTRGRSAAQEQDFLNLRCSLGQVGVLDKVIQAREPLVIEDAARSPLIDPVLARRFDLTSCLLIPLIATGEVIGVVGLNDTSGPRQFTCRDIRLATGVANQLAIAIDNTHLFSEVSAHKTALQRLSVRLTNVLEEERARISRELHDGLGQVLSGMSIGLDVLEEKVPPSLSNVKEGLGQIKALTEKTLDELRRLSHDLRPSLLDDLGLRDALQWLVDYLAERCGWAARLIVEADFPRLSPKIETTLFRISQEALNNIKTHAKASKVTVRLRPQQDVVQLEIEDDGCGFDPVDRGETELREHGIGLLSMQERAMSMGGKLFIESEIGRGTTIKVVIPGIGGPDVVSSAPEAKPVDMIEENHS